MPALHVRADELRACGHDLADGARRLGDAARAFDHRSGDGTLLGHPLATDAYEQFFGAWSTRLHDSAAVLEESAQTVVAAADGYTAWESFVAGLTR